MSAGSVSIAVDGTATKSGLAGAIYDARVASLALVQPPGVIPSGPSGYAVKHGLALDANALASAIYTGSGVAPAGALIAFAGAAAPSGWLLCNGASYLRADYADLFTAIGTTYGAADGTHFNVPDLRGRAAIGAGLGSAADATTRALGDADGTETHTLTTAQLAAHSHGVTDPGHQHTPNIGDTFLTAYGTGTLLKPGAGVTAEESNQTANATTGVTVNNAGGGDPHPNMPPVLAVNWIIKT